MSELSNNTINFFKEFATSLDKNKDKLKQTEVNFQVALANCGDHHDDITKSQEDQLSAKVTEMERAIHHVMLNDKLKECFDLLDQIQRTYRNYNEEYIKVLLDYPNKMDSFFEEFEADSLGIFKRFPEDQKERIQELYVKETEDAQAKLEAEALKKWEDEKKIEEAKAAEDTKKAAADPKGKKAPPPKKGKEADKPNIDVPKLDVPEIKDYTSNMGQKFVIERSFEDIADKLIKPAPSEEEENAQDANAEGNPNEENNEGAIRQDSALSNNRAAGEEGAAVEGEEGEGEEEKKEEWLADVVENDHLEKAALLPPKDPEGEDTLTPDLMLTKDKMISILEKALSTTLEWLLTEKTQYNQKARTEGKKLQDESVEELDENLRKQWPRKGRLEVEVFQERKSQITNHNRKYDRQVRGCLEKYNQLEEEWGFILDKISEEFDAFRSQF